MFDLDVVETRSLSESGIDMTVHQIGSNKPLLNRQGDPVKLKLLGPDSALYRKLSRAQLRKRLERASAQTQVEIDEGAEAEADALDIIVACTVGWSGVNDKEGKEIPFSQSNVRQFYEQFPAVRDQSDIFIASRANFIKASPKA